jgi:4-diphosphocytidyl-2C-methyl-D-erythritol kinase
LELLAPAKINLFLRVIGRRPDGYHELRSLMCCIDLYDRMLLKFGTLHNEIVCAHVDVPEDETNLAIKAVVLFNNALGSETVHRPVNVSVILVQKRYPSARAWVVAVVMPPLYSRGSISIMDFLSVKREYRRWRWN